MPFLWLLVFTKMNSETHGAGRSTEPVDLRDLIETIPALVLCALADGSAEFANRAWHEYTGCSSPELTGWGWHAAIHPDDLPKLIQEWTVATAAGKPFETEARVRRADGEYQWFAIRKALSVSRDQVGKPSLRTLIACEDIQERKQAQDRLQQSEQRWQTAFENSAIGIIIRDRADRFLAANRAFRTMLRYTELELYQLRSIDVTYEEDRELNLELIRELWEGKRQHFEIEKRYRRKDGTLVWVRNNVALVPGTAGVAPFLFTVVEDITERKKEESEAEELRASLHATQLQLAQVSRLTTMGELTASIAHEVNQPLTAVTNNANACLRLLARRNLDPEVLRRALEEIVADGTRASSVIARIRGFIKKAPAEKSDLDINEVIQEVLALARRELSENRVLLEPQLMEALPPVLADRVQLQQVLLNLIMNGVEAMTALTSRPRLLWVQSRIDESGDVLIAVRDSGPGLGSESDRVFTPFFTTKANGMGMGLPISRSLIEGHGGRLWATPNSPHGAVFSFTLPTAAGSPP